MLHILKNATQHVPIAEGRTAVYGADCSNDLEMWVVWVVERGTSERMHKLLGH